MRRKLALVAVLGAFSFGCGNKQSESGGNGSATAGPASGSAVVAEKPITCPAGSAVGQDGACVAVVTPQAVEAVVQQKSRIDDLSALLDKVSILEDPLALITSLTSLDQWKEYRTQFSQLEVIEAAAVTLDTAVKQIKELKISLAGASGALGDIKTTLDGVMTASGASAKVEALRTEISTKLRTSLEPLALQVAGTITRVITPLTDQLIKVEDTVTIVCAAARLKGGSPQIVDSCAKAKTLVTAAVQYIADLKDKPAALYDEVSKTLEQQLATLVDEQAKAAIATTQKAVSDALKLPAPVAGSGSGSATP